MSLRPLLVALVLAGCTEDGPPPAAAPPPPPAAPRPAAVLQEVRGAVTAFHRQVGAPARDGTELFPGDAVETGEEGRALLRFAGGRLVSLEPDGRI